MTALSESLVLQKTKLDKLEQVKNLNLWGSDLIDVSMLPRLPNLEVLALSVNHVTTLKDIGLCTNVRELYLRKNDISDLAEVHHLSKLPFLQVLWLVDNPVAAHPEYRLFTIRSCPTLKQFDNIEVSPQERAQAERIPQSKINEIMGRQTEQSKPQMARGANMPPQPTLPDDPAAPPRRGNPSPLVDKSPTPLGPGNNRQTQKAIMSAVMSLLSELSVESLEFLHNEIGQRIDRQRSK